METNEKLLKLYTSKMELLKTSLFEYNQNHVDKATNPLLLKVSDNWENAEIKIMIIGQETYEWCGECGTNGRMSEFSANIQKSLEIYDTFFLQKKGYRSPFWNEFRRIIKTVKSEKAIDYCWNNIIKIGRVGKGNIAQVNDIIKIDFDVLQEEIKILKPNILIFFTGPKYDYHIRRFIGDFKTEKVEGFENNELSELTFPDYNFDLCLKIYHPNYLYFSKKRKFVMDGLIKELNNNVNK